MNDFLNKVLKIVSSASKSVKNVARSVAPAGKTVKEFAISVARAAADIAGKTGSVIKGKVVRQKPVRKYSGNRRRQPVATNRAQVVYQPSARRVVAKKPQRNVVATAKQKAEQVKEKLVAAKEKMNYKRAAVALTIAVMCIITPVVAVIATNSGEDQKLLPEAQAVAMAESEQPSEDVSQQESSTTEESAQAKAVSNEDTGESDTMEASTVVEQQSDIAEPSPEATEEAVEEQPVVLQEGVDSPEVAKLQARLMELDYMENDEPTEHFGPITAYAVQLFQRKHDLQIDGIAGGETLELIYADDAKHYTVSEGVNGTDVEELQKRLVELGYLTTGVTGYFGTDTAKAVEAFQQRNNLTVDGNVGSATREALYSEDAVKAPEPEPEESKDSGKKEESSSSSNKDKDKGSSSSSSSDSKKEESTSKVPDDQSVNSFIKIAKQQLGKKYVRGGKGPDVFDCSGFVYYCLNKAGYKINYMTSAGWANSSFPKVTSINDMKKGDIICFKGHVGIYLGGKQMIDASSSEGKIRITGNLGTSSYWKNNFICGRRVLVK